MKLRNNRLVFRLTFLGLCLALYIVFSFFTIKIGGAQEITFKGFPVVLISVVCGPVDGIIVAGIGEFIAQLTGPYGLTPTTALWILPHITRALIVGLMFKHKNPLKHPVRWIICVIVSGLSVTLLNSVVIYIDALIFEYPSLLTAISIVSRSLTAIATSVIYGMFAPQLIKVLFKLNKLEEKDSD